MNLHLKMSSILAAVLAIMAGSALAGPVQVPFAGLPYVELSFVLSGQNPTWTLSSQDGTNAFYSWQGNTLHLWLEPNTTQSIVHFSLTPPTGQSLSVNSYTAKVVRPTAGLHAVLVPNQRRIAQELSYPATPDGYTPLYRCLIPQSFSESAAANVEAPFILLTTSTGDNALAVGWAVASVGATLSGVAEGSNYALTILRQNDIPFTGSVLSDALIISTAANCWFDVERAYAQSFDAYNGRQKTPAPDWTSEPVFCTWYCYLDNINQQQVLDVAWKCKELGFGTILIDAGWDCNPNGGYADFNNGILGDFIARPDRFPNLPAAVSQMHAWGLKVELWSAPFWQGKKSQVYQTMTGTWHLWSGATENYSLCPRYVGTRQYLYDKFRWVAQTYGIDGMWLDSADSIPSACTATHQHVSQPMGAAFTDCMVAVRDGLKSVNPLAITEARVTHGNLNNKIALDIVQPSDAPKSFEPLRISDIHIRAWAYDIVLKNDPMIWDRNDSATTIGKYLATVVTSGVPDLSVDFLTAPEWQCQLTKVWFSFYKQHKETLLKGQFKLFGADYTSPDMALIGAKEAVVYARNVNTTQAVLPTTLIDIIVLNCTTSNNMNLHLPAARGRYTAQSYNPDWTAYGSPTTYEATEYVALNQVVPQGGAVTVSRIPQVLQVKPAGAITIDGNTDDWNLPEFTTPIEGGECGTGDIAIVGYDSGVLYYGGCRTDWGLPANASDHTARVYSRQNRNHLYFLVRCDDDDIRYPYPSGSNSSNDCVEFYIDPSHGHGLTPLFSSSSDIQLTIDAGNQKNAYGCDPSYASQVLGGVESAVSTDSTGWWLEVTIAKAALNPDIPQDGTFGLDFCFRDNDNNNNPAQSTAYTWGDVLSGPAFPSKVPGNWGNALMPDVTHPSPVTDLVASPDDGKVVLSWTNPADPDYTATRIVCKNSSYPAGPTDGVLVVDRAGAPGEMVSYSHPGLTNGTKYFYSAFAHDASLNYAPPAMASATPSAAPPSVISISPFASDLEGWVVSTWKSGTYALGSMVWNGSAGNPSGAMRCAGSGATDNDNTCTREGGEIRKTISTVGYANIRVAYDLRVSSLGAVITGASGGCSVDHGMNEEQLTVFYSTNGGTSWTELDWLDRADLDSYTTYGTRVIDLSGVTAASNNPSFTLRFRWQVNTGSDIGDLDNITVTGRSTAGPVSIQQAKSLPNGAVRPLQAKVISGVFADCFYIQEPGTCFGLKVVPAVVALTGQGADVLGTMRGQGAERYLDTAGGSVEIFDPGPAAVFPWGPAQP